MTVERVAPGVYAIPGLKMGRAYLIDDRDGLTLVDTSSPGAAGGVLRAIAALGRDPADLRTIVATHYHFDHTGNAGALRERSNARLCAGADDVPYIDGRRPWGTGRRTLLDALPAPATFALDVEHALRDGDSIDAAGGLDVVATPGHTPGHIALYAPERGALFAGDAFMNVAGLQLPPSASSHDMAEAKRSIAGLATLSFDVALPGHGRPILNRASEKLAAWAQRWL